MEKAEQQTPDMPSPQPPKRKTEDGRAFPGIDQGVAGKVCVETAAPISDLLSQLCVLRAMAMAHHGARLVHQDMSFLQHPKEHVEIPTTVGDRPHIQSRI